MKSDDQNFSAAMPFNVVLCGGMRNQSFCPTNKALRAAEWQCRAAPHLSPPKRVASRSTARAQESSSSPCTTGSPRVSMVRSWAPRVPRGTRRHLEAPRIPWPSSLSLLAPFRSRESMIRRLSDADGFPPDPLHEAIACAQVSCHSVHEVSEHHGPARCEVVSAIRFGREGVHFEHDLPLHCWIHHLEFIADGAGATNSMVMRSSIPWNMPVPLDSPTLAHQSSWMSTSHFKIQRQDVTWIPRRNHWWHWREVLHR